MSQPLTVIKSTGPKLVPFLKTTAVFFVLFPLKSTATVLCALFKCAPLVSLMAFVLFYGLSHITDAAYSYPRRILAGLAFSCAGDAFLLWKSSGYFLHGMAMFGAAHLCYVWAFGFRPLRFRLGVVAALPAGAVYAYVFPGLHGIFVPACFGYVVIIYLMVWRALARLFEDGYRFTDWWPGVGACAVGAVLFAVSDSVLAIDMFHTAVPFAHPLVMTTYYAAQMCIAISVVDSHYHTVLRMSRDEPSSEAAQSNGSTTDASATLNHLTTHRRRAIVECVAD